MFTLDGTKCVSPKHFTPSVLDMDFNINSCIYFWIFFISDFHFDDFIVEDVRVFRLSKWLSFCNENMDDLLLVCIPSYAIKYF